jgi:hypothetical protein
MQGFNVDILRQWLRFTRLIINDTMFPLPVAMPAREAPTR